MAKLYDALDDRLRAFIASQPVFFVATAPSSGGHVNLSPKGLSGSLVVVDDRTVAYVDLTGSGAETAAHLRDNGRITIMFCAFDGPPKILRLSGTGSVVGPAHADWARLRSLFPAHRGARAVVVVDVERIADSCGYAVPLMAYAGERDLLDQWTDRKDDAALADYRRRHNTVSIDGLPAFDQVVSSAETSGLGG